MQALTPEGQQKIGDIAALFGLSTNAVTAMLHALLRGGGTMAQFNIPELGGNGQWMKGGMTMVGDMFNYSLQANVNNLCNELSPLVFSKNIFAEPPPQQQGKGQFLPANSWWPSDFGAPTASGSQNNMRYVYFAPPVSRLVVEMNGKQSIYDTLTHHISGISQQQGSGGSILFTSQHGQVDIHKLPLISGTGESAQAPQPVPAQPAKPLYQAAASAVEDIIATIERLADLLKKGILTEEEFDAKKSELLKRL